MNKNLLLDLPKDPVGFASWLVRCRSMYKSRRTILNFDGVYWATAVADVVEVCQLTGLDVEAVCGISGEAPSGIVVKRLEQVRRPWLAYPDIHPMVLTNRVRTGQKIENPLGDIDVLDSVSSGGEVIAGGSVRVAGMLSGNVVAGLDSPDGMILCGDFRAEVVSLSGNFVTGEKIDKRIFGKPVKIVIANGKLSFEVVSLSDIEFPLEEVGA